ENFTHAKVGGPGIIKAQQTPARLTAGTGISYAAGLVVTTTDGVREVSHGGATGGYRTWLARFPDQGVSVAVLCNSASANPSKLGHETARLWTGAPAGSITSNYAAAPVTLQALAGMYRKVRDNTVVKLQWQDGKLKWGTATALTPKGLNQFGAAGREYRFEEGPPVRVRSSGPDDEVLYERVEPAQPSASDLAELVGEYDSRETAATLTISSGAPGELMLRVATEKPVPLRPTFRDAFAMPSGASIFFVRDTAGKVTALSAGDDRAWDLRFTRLR
ncbi:MAG: serine hydrolase, partial [Bryobacteraceae bacterium]